MKNKSDLRRYTRKAQLNWIESKAIFTKKDLLIKSYQVMQRWENNYMKSLASITTSRGGDILEVGFGLGISARYIEEESRRIRTHTIIECHPDVLAFAKSSFGEAIKSGRMKFIEGFWEDTTPKMPNEAFDGILFDSCPLESGVEFFHFFPFFPEAYRLLKQGGVFTYFSDEPTEISEQHRNKLIEAGFKEERISYKICKVHPPRACEYWKFNTIVSPIIRKS